MRSQDPEKLGFKRVTSLSPDGRGRITLSKLLKRRPTEPASFAAYVNDAGQIMLDPVVEVPTRERWLYRSQKAMKALKAGLDSATKQPLVRLGSFAKYAKDD
jgi:hypothetical protein